MMYDVVTMGSATADVFVNTHTKEVRGRLQYPTGTKILIRDISFHTGGCGVNTAISMRSLGCKTGFLGKIGNDENGKRVLKTLKKHKIKFLGAVGKEITGYSIILDSMEHNRTILHYKGANNTLDFGEIKRGSLSTKWLYMSSMLGKSFATEKKLASMAKEKGIRIAYNPGIDDARGGRKRIGGILKASDILILNREEANILSGKKGVTRVMKALLSMGPDVVCITDGGRKAYCCDRQFYYSMMPHKVKIKERTGAGDAFAGGFMSGMIKTGDIEFSMQLGLANSESVIQQFGATNKILTQEEALKELKKRPGRVVKSRLG